MDIMKNLDGVKPKLRGWIHEIAFFVSWITGPTLVAISRSGERIGAAIYSLSLSALFGVSALYHRPNWRPSIRKWLRKLDHTMILFLIAGTFTPVAIRLHSTLAKVVLIVIWAGAAAGGLLQLLPIRVPKPITVIPYLAMGWLGISVLPQSFTKFGPTFPVLLLVGGIFYTLGAIAYARRRPNLVPGIFGYHELFHAFVVVAAYCHYAGILSTIKS